MTRELKKNLLVLVKGVKSVSTKETRTNINDRETLAFSPCSENMPTVGSWLTNSSDGTHLGPVCAPFLKTSSLQHTPALFLCLFYFATSPFHTTHSLFTPYTADFTDSLYPTLLSFLLNLLIIYISNISRFHI